MSTIGSLKRKINDCHSSNNVNIKFAINIDVTEITETSRFTNTTHGKQEEVKSISLDAFADAFKIDKSCLENYKITKQDQPNCRAFPILTDVSTHLDDYDSLDNIEIRTILLMYDITDAEEDTTQKYNIEFVINNGVHVFGTNPYNCVQYGNLYHVNGISLENFKKLFDIADKFDEKVKHYETYGNGFLRPHEQQIHLSAIDVFHDNIEEVNATRVVVIHDVVKC